MREAPAPTTSIESLLRHERGLIAAGFLFALLMSWGWLVPAALDMSGDMDGFAAWMMNPHWDLTYGILIFCMWAAMMAGMMLPSAAPTLLLYAVVCRRDPDGGSPVPRVYAFAGGYLATWTAFSAGAAVLQWKLSQLQLITPMMKIGSPLLTGATLILAGVYQWTPLKQSCLASCRSPAAFISTHWRRGIGGALRMGLAHGLFCLGCCWALMLLLFVGGVMSLACIAAITLFVLLEKLAPWGVYGGRLSGVLLVATGAWLLQN